MSYVHSRIDNQRENAKIEFSTLCVVIFNSLFGSRNKIRKGSKII